MYTSYLFLALIPLLSQHIKAHDPRYKLSELIALPLIEDYPECAPIISSNCQDDTCACALTAQAEACVRCMSTSESVDKYNDYLGACASIGQAAPTTTHAVSPVVASTTTQLPAVSGQFTDITGAMGVESQGVGSADLEQPSAIAPVASNTPIVSSSSMYRGIGGQTQAQAGSASGLPTPLNAGAAGTVGSALPAPLNGASAGSGTEALDPHGINVINDTTSSPRDPPTVNASIKAVNSSRNFFSQAISQTCVQRCIPWKTRLDSCTDDHCLCDPQVICAAADCSACVGSSGRGEQIGTCYSEFRDTCAAIGVAAATTCWNATASGQGTLTDQLTPSSNAQIAGGTLAGHRQPVASQANLPYGYGGSAGAGQIQPMLVTNAQGVTASVYGSSLSTQIVTATAGAMIAQETIVVDAGAGCLRVPAVTVLVCSLLGLVMAIV